MSTTNPTPRAPQGATLDMSPLDADGIGTLDYRDVIAYVVVVAPDVDPPAVWRRLEAGVYDSATNREAIDRAIVQQREVS